MTAMRDNSNLPSSPLAHVVARLALRALEGPPWSLPDEELPLGAANDAALVLFLAGDRDAGDALLRRRWRFLKQSGAQLWIQHDFIANSKLKKAPQFYE